jgi:hypothetical protein
MQGWFRRAQLSTTLDTYTHPVDDGLGGAEVWDKTLPVTDLRGRPGAIAYAETAVNDTSDAPR